MLAYLYSISQKDFSKLRKSFKQYFQLQVYIHAKTGKVRFHEYSIII
jgi:hypothetical protein